MVYKYRKKAMKKRRAVSDFWKSLTPAERAEYKARQDWRNMSKERNPNNGQTKKR